MVQFEGETPRAHQMGNIGGLHDIIEFSEPPLVFSTIPKTKIQNHKSWIVKETLSINPHISFLPANL